MDITTAIASLKTAYAIVKGMKGMMDEAKVNEVKIALQEAILDAQDKIRDGRDELDQKNAKIAELEGEIKRAGDWSAQAANYELKEISTGIFAYVPKVHAKSDSYASVEKYCPHCFDKGVKSHYQAALNPAKGGSVLICPNKCPAIQFGWFNAIR